MTQTEKRRIHLIDEIRGFCILAMIFHHTAVDLVVLFGDRRFLPFYYFCESIRLPFVFAFILISGFACRLTRSNAIRGVKLMGIALVITLVTYFLFPEQVIWCGILHMLALCMLIFAALRPLLDKVPMWVGIIVSLVLFLLTFWITDGVLGIPGLAELPLPADLVASNWLFPIGICSFKFQTTMGDYFPLLPWLFLFLAGSFLGLLANRNKLPEFMYRKHVGFLAFVGRHTLWVYVLHQPIVYGVLYVIYNWILA